MMSWVSGDGLKKAIIEIVRGTFTAAATSPEIASTICSLGLGSIDNLDFSDVVPMVTDAHFKSIWASHAMACIGLSRYPEFRARALEYYSREVPRTNADTLAYATLFAEGPVQNGSDSTVKALTASMQRMCEEYPLGPASPACGQALVRLGSSDTETVRGLIALLKSATSVTQIAYAQAYPLASAALSELEDAFVGVYQTGYRMEIERYFAARPPVKPENRMKLLNELVTKDDGRAPDEMLFILRDTKMTLADFTNLNRTIQYRRPGMLNQHAYAGLIGLAANAGADKKIIEDLFNRQRDATALDQAGVDAIDVLAKRPEVRDGLKRACSGNGSRPVARQGVPVYSYDDFGNVRRVSVAVKTCDQVLAESK